MYSRFSLSNVDQNGILGDVQNDQKPLHESVCKWLKSNNRWREWVPKEELDCKLGEFLEKNASEAGLGKCTKCKPGYSSEGGSVLKCYPCPPGDIRVPRSSLSAWPFRCTFCAEAAMVGPSRTGFTSPCDRSVKATPSVSAAPSAALAAYTLTRAGYAESMHGGHVPAGPARDRPPHLRRGWAHP